MSGKRNGICGILEENKNKKRKWRIDMQADQINENEMKLEFDARSVNEGFARMAVAAFVAELNPDTG